MFDELVDITSLVSAKMKEGKAEREKAIKEEQEKEKTKKEPKELEDLDKILVYDDEDEIVPYKEEVDDGRFDDLVASFEEETK